MAAITVPVPNTDSHQLMTTTLRQLRHFLTSFSNIQMSEDECEALAVAAVSGHAEAEFMIGSVFDAAGETDCAIQWYQRAALRNYLPAILQMFAIR